MPPILSVIIPVFNAEKHLNDCLYSVTAQSFVDVEIICVDDGSTDASLSILKEWEERDKRVTVIQQGNRGPSAARNVGITVSKGIYITFVDADDIVKKEIYTTSIKIADNDSLDVLIFGIETIPNGNVTFSSFPKNRILNYHQLFLSNPHIHSEDALCFSSVRCLFKNSIIKTHLLRFPEKVFYGEDMLFNIDVVCHSCRIMVIDKPLYLYRKNPNGAMMKKFKPLLESSLVISYSLKNAQINLYRLNDNSSYLFDMAKYHIKIFLPMLIHNEYHRPNQNNLKKSINHILSLDMIRESFKQIGFRKIDNNWNSYFLFLAMKFKMAGIVKLLYDKIYNNCKAY